MTQSAKNPPLSLKIMVLNAENLFLLSDQVLDESHLELDEKKWQKLSTSIYNNKPLRKCIALAKTILDINADIILLAEVGGPESLANFNRLFLQNRYSPALTEGNSDRNIDIGFLVRKNMGFYFDLISNKNRPIHFLYPHELENENTEKLPTSHKFSRDVAELHLFTRDREKPFLLFLLTHLKSRLDPENKDPNGFLRRQAELKTLLEIYQEFEKKFSGKVPIVVAGDLNGNASKNGTDIEFLPIYQNTNLHDICELANLSSENSATYYQVSRNSKVDGRQIDYAFLSPSAAHLLENKSVQAYRYKDHLGKPFEPPSTLEAKMALPSDHYPLIFELKNIPVID